MFIVLTNGVQEGEEEDDHPSPVHSRAELDDLHLQCRLHDEPGIK